MQYNTPYLMSEQQPQRFFGSSQPVRFGVISYCCSPQSNISFTLRVPWLGASEPRVGVGCCQSAALHLIFSQKLHSDTGVRHDGLRTRDRRVMNPARYQWATTPRFMPETKQCHSLTYCVLEHCQSTSDFVAQFIPIIHFSTHTLFFQDIPLDAISNVINSHLT